MHSVEMPLYFSENATFDELWNTYANGTDSTMEDGGDFIMRGGTSPANGCVDSMFQPLLSLNIAGLQDLMDSSQDPSAMFDDFSTEPTSLGKDQPFMTPPLHQIH